MPATQGPEADSELMRQLCFADGDSQTDALFGELFDRYHRRIVTWCFHLTHDRDGSADLAQEVLMKAYRYRRSWRGDSRLSTWLYAITRNHCLTAIRKRSSSAAVETVLSPRLRDSSTLPPDVAAERRQLYAIAGSVITRSLEPLEARVLALHYGFGVPLREITRDLDLQNPSGAKAYIVNARRKLSGKMRLRGAFARKAA